MNKITQPRFWGMMCLLATVPAMVCLTGCAAPGREVRLAPYQVVYAQDAPVMDGKLDDAVWQEAEVLKDFYQHGKTGAKFTDIIRAMMAWDKEHLYFAVTIKDKDIFVSEKIRDEIICRADVVELFIKPAVVTRYTSELYEFEFNVWETIWDIHYVGYGGGSALPRFSHEYNPAIVCKATYNGTINDWSDIDEGYTIEVAFPLSAFAHAAPNGVTPGDIWKFNVAGMDYSVYLRRPLEFTSVDGNTLGFAEYELYPEMIFMPPR